MSATTTPLPDVTLSTSANTTTWRDLAANSEGRTFADDGYKSDFELFCLTCHQCIREPERGVHTDHELTKVKEAKDSQMTQCQTLIDRTFEASQSISMHLEHLVKLRNDLVARRKAIAVELDNIFREIEYKLHERKMSLFTQLTDLSYRKECYLDDLIHTLTDRRESLTHLEKTLAEQQEKITDNNLISYNCHQLKELDESVRLQTDKMEMQLIENTDLQFHKSGVGEVKKAIHSMARVTASDVLPGKTTCSGDGLKKSCVQKQTIVRVTPRDKDGAVVREAGLQFKAKLYNESVEVECQVTENPNNTYTVLYIAPEAATYKLSIQLFNQHIKSSPFQVKITPGSRVTFSKSTEQFQLTSLHSMRSSPVQVTKFSVPRGSSPRSVSSADSYSSLKILPAVNAANHSVTVEPPFGDYLSLIGKFGRKKGEFCNPQGVCVDSNGRVYCTDSTNQTIQTFTDSGSHISTLERRGRNVGQFLRPIGVAFSRDGCLLFCDYETKCVNVFKDGAFIRRIGSGRLVGPKGVALTHRGTVLVVDNKGSEVLEFSIKGRLIQKIPHNKSDKSLQLAGPHYVAVNRHGDIHVTEFHSHCVKVFNREGQYLRTFGNHGAGNGQFNAPTGIAIDNNGCILVADWGNSRIQIFDEEGSFISLVDTSCSPLFGPQSIYVTRDHRVIVADSGNHCVKIFRYENLSQ